MSRLGKRPITIPAGVEVSVKDGELVVKGKGGTLKRPVHGAVKINIEGSTISVEPVEKTRVARAMWGTMSAHVRNMISGVVTPFAKKLQIEGIGFKVEMQGKNLKFALGFSHPIIVAIPEGITITIEKNIVTVAGANKDQVGQFAASIRDLKRPEPYKGKGIRYEGERVREKEGKKAAGAAA